MRMYGFTGLSNLMVCIHPAGIDNGTGSPDNTAERLSQVFSQFDTRFGIFTDTAADGNNDVRSDQVYDILCRFLNFENINADVGFGKLNCRFFNYGLCRFCRIKVLLLHNTGTHSCNLRAEARTHNRCHQVTAKSRTGHL